ncbi:MAG: hypothetical protein HY918_00780 [Candidatus Doudnabacteria bacterium]|nr:hypothetical protein [Candidatus Doudnabacteria bacterium]
MKLVEFIEHLNTISLEVENPDEVFVEMADCMPVVKPAFKDGVVFITDTK